MAVLTDEQKGRVQKFFEQLTGQVTMVLVAPPAGGAHGEAFAEMLGELADLSEHLSWRQVTPESPEAAEWQLERYPALVLLDSAGRDRGMRFYGAPTGYEFMTLLEDLVDLSRNQPRLSEAAMATLQGVEQEVKIEVFTTPG